MINYLIFIGKLCTKTYRKQKRQETIVSCLLVEVPCGLLDISPLLTKFYQILLATLTLVKASEDKTGNFGKIWLNRTDPPSDPSLYFTVIPSNLIFSFLSKCTHSNFICYMYMRVAISAAI